MTKRMAALAILIAGCNRQGAQQPGSAVVAVVGSRAITADEVDRRMADLGPQARARGATADGRRAALELIVKQELLAQEAEREGLADAPAVREQTRRAMVQELLHQKLDKDLAGAAISDDELQRYYQSHLDDFVRPERVQLLRIHFDDKPDRAAAKKKAGEVLAGIVAAERRGEVHAFENAARRSSDDALSRPAGGELSALTRRDLERQLGPEVAEAAFQLRTPGETRGPIETPQGVELIRLQAHHAALTRTFADARESLRSVLVRDRRQRDYEDLVKRLRESAKVTINDDALVRPPAQPQPQQPPPQPSQPSQPQPSATAPAPQKVIP